MANPELLLHIGTHKTGTTSLQRYFSQNRAALREDGLVYPQVPDGIKTLRMAHHHVASALSDCPGEELSATQVVGYLDNLRNSVRLGEKLVLSSERFCRCTFGGSDGPGGNRAARKRFVENVGKHLELFDTRILVSIRPQDEFLASLYKGWCARSTVLSSGFREYVEMHVVSTDYHALLTNWSDTFGSDRVLVQKYPPSSRGTAGLQSILNGFGIKHRINGQVQSHDRHKSPSLLGAEVLRAISFVDAGPSVLGAVKKRAMEMFEDAANVKQLETCFGERRFAIPFEVSPKESNEAVRRQFFPEQEGPLFGRDIQEHLSELFVIDPERLADFIENVFEDAGFGQEFKNATK